MTLKSLASTVLARLESTPVTFTSLLARLAVADVFWRSGETKVEGWQVTQTTIDLFRDEYQVPLLPPEVAAWMAAIQEHLFSALLLVGLASRLSALGLFGMTMVIQLFVYPANWPDHLLWSALLIAIIARGPGKLSADHFIRQALLGTAPGPRTTGPARGEIAMPA